MIVTGSCFPMLLFPECCLQRVPEVNSLTLSLLPSGVEAGRHFNEHVNTAPLLQVPESCFPLIMEPLRFFFATTRWISMTFGTKYSTVKMSP